MSDKAGVRPAGSLHIGPQTQQLAQRLLANAQVLAEELPSGCNTGEAFNILLLLYIAEDSGNCTVIADLVPPGSLAPSVTRRWVDALIAIGMVERVGELIALSSAGHDKMSHILDRMYAAQCAIR